MISAHTVIFENGLTGTIFTRDVWGDAWAAEYNGPGICEANFIGGYEYETEAQVLEAMKTHLEKCLGWAVKEVE